MTSKSRRLWHNKKVLAFEREHEKCHYCSEPLFLETMTLDHIVPKAFNGPMANWNLVASCESCNSVLGNAVQKCGCERCRRAVSRFHRETRIPTDGLEVKWRRKHFSDDEVVSQLLSRIDKAKRRLAVLEETDLGAVALRGKISGYREALCVVAKPSVAEGSASIV